MDATMSEDKVTHITIYPSTCISCGESVPEGNQVCRLCELKNNVVVHDIVLGNIYPDEMLPH